MSFENYFKGKSILVTGAGRGIGNAIAKKLYELDACVYALSRTPETLQKLKSECPNITTICADLGDWEKTREALFNLNVAFDGIVNNAAIAFNVSLLNVTMEELDRILNVNLKSTVNVSQCLVPKIIDAGKPCSIVNISSVAAKAVFPGMGPYAVSKAALNHLTKCMALEFGPNKIRVNSINPGGVETDMLSDVIKSMKLPVPMEQFVEMQKPRYPLGEVLIPMPDIVNSTLFLLSDAAKMITGTNLYIDGGFTIT